MKVYHASNQLITTLVSGSYLTPDRDLAKVFGCAKPSVSGIWYLHEFDAEILYPAVKPHLLTGRLFLDYSAMCGELERTKTPEGEDWQNYKSVVPLIPASVIPYNID